MIDDTLILGLAAGYHYGDVRPFAASLERTGFAGECVLFASQTTRDAERIAAHGVQVVGFERPAEMGHVPYNAYRYFLYRDFLRNASRRYERILVTDVRDVIFQRDPFAFSWDEGVNVTLEDARMTIGDCPYMTRWMSGHLGEAAWEAVKDRRISCSGTTVAGHEAMLEYLDRLIGLLLPYAPGKMMAGYDQGVHNHLLHNGLIPDVAVHDNAGPILTLGYKQEDPAQNEAGEILSDSGQPAVIVHQYDRKPELFRQVRERYV